MCLILNVSFVVSLNPATGCMACSLNRGFERRMHGDTTVVYAGGIRFLLKHMLFLTWPFLEKVQTLERLFLSLYISRIAANHYNSLAPMIALD